MDNDFPASSAQPTSWTPMSGEVQQTAWGPLDWIKRRLGGQEQQGPPEEALPKPGTILDRRRERQKAIEAITG